MSHHEHHEKECRCEGRAHECIKVAKVVLKAASVAAAFCAVKELHRIHRSIEAHRK